jgi:hypothetical protein
VECERIDDGKQGFDDRPQGCLPQKRFGDKRGFEHHVVLHVREHGLQILAPHRLGEGVDVGQYHERSPIVLGGKVGNPPVYWPDLAAVGEPAAATPTLTFSLAETRLAVASRGAASSVEAAVSFATSSGGALSGRPQSNGGERGQGFAGEGATSPQWWLSSASVLSVNVPSSYNKSEVKGRTGSAGCLVARRLVDGTNAAVLLLKRLCKRRRDVEIVLVGRDNFVMLTPLLFEFCSGALDARHCSLPFFPRPDSSEPRKNRLSGRAECV